MKDQKRRNANSLLVFFGLILIDLVSKVYSRQVNQFTANDGVGFGILQGGEWLVLIGFILLVLVIGDLKPVEKGLILAGGVGNLIDRLIFKEVTDWLVFGGLWFNLADLYLTIGVFIVIIRSINEYRDKSDNNI